MQTCDIRIRPDHGETAAFKGLCDPRLPTEKISDLFEHPCKVFREERTDFLVVLKDQWLITANYSQLSPLSANGRHP